MQPTDIETRVSNIEKIITQMSEDAFPWVKNTPITQSGNYVVRVHFPEETGEAGSIEVKEFTGNTTATILVDEDGYATISEDNFPFEMDDIVAWIKIPDYK